MNVALLTAGPSLHRCVEEHPLEDFDVIVTVNSAGRLYGMDWHAAVDDHSMQPWLDGTHRLPREGFVSTTRLLKKLEHLGRKAQRISRIGQYTFPGALAFAQRLGQVTVMGYDRSEADDCAGFGSDHSPSRWANEAAAVRKVARPDTLFFGGDCVDTPLLDVTA